MMLCLCPRLVLAEQGKKDVRMHLSVSGFFDSAKMYEAGDPPEDLTIADPK
jgi:hypothetical protein